MYWCLLSIFKRVDWLKWMEDRETPRMHEYGESRRLEIQRQLNFTSLPKGDVRNFSPLDFCSSRVYTRTHLSGRSYLTFWRLTSHSESNESAQTHTKDGRSMQCHVIHLSGPRKIQVRVTPRVTIPQHLCSVLGHDGSVGIATCYRLDGPGIESRWGARFSSPVQNGPGDQTAFCTMDTGCFPEVKRRGAALTNHAKVSEIMQWLPGTKFTNSSTILRHVLWNNATVINLLAPEFYI
jgi:hypothetical protein